MLVKLMNDGKLTLAAKTGTSLWNPVKCMYVLNKCDADDKIGSWLIALQSFCI